MAEFGYYEVPDAGVQLEEADMRAFIANVNLGIGTLYVADSRMVWLKPSGQGFKVIYSDVVTVLVRHPDQKYEHGSIAIVLNDTDNGDEDHLYYFAEDDNVFNNYNNGVDNNGTVELTLAGLPTTDLFVIYNSLVACYNSFIIAHPQGNNAIAALPNLDGYIHPNGYEYQNVPAENEDERNEYEENDHGEVGDDEVNIDINNDNNGAEQQNSDSIDSDSDKNEHH